MQSNSTEEMDDKLAECFGKLSHIGQGTNSGNICRIEPIKIKVTNFLCSLFQLQAFFELKLLQEINTYSIYQQFRLH